MRWSGGLSGFPLLSLLYTVYLPTICSTSIDATALLTEYFPQYILMVYLVGPRQKLL
jgi:hypothetical protein